MRIYAMGDIHGCLQEFNKALDLVGMTGDNMLVLLGDYIHGPDSYGVMDRVVELQNIYGKDKVIALRGNHEAMAIDGSWPIGLDEGNPQLGKEVYQEWMESLPRYFTTNRQIFVHAGVDEEAGEMLELITDDAIFTDKFPPQTGSFYKDIIAGHVATDLIAGHPGYFDIFFDGMSHFYMDGNVLEGGTIPVIMVETKSNKYYRVTETGNWLILPYDQEN